MKIALVYDLIYPYSVGGVEIRNYQLAEYLSEKGHEVHIYGVKMWPGHNVIKKNNIVIHGICRYKDKYFFFGNRRIVDIIRFSKALKRELKKYLFELVDCTAFPYLPAFICKEYCERNKIPLVITWHEVWQNYWYRKLGILGFIGKCVEKKVSKLSKNNLVVSKKTGEDLLNLNKNKKSIAVINNWLNLLDIIKTKPSKPKSDIVFTGRHLKHKNIDILIKSLVFVKKELPNVRLLIIGNGPETKNLKLLTKKLNLQSNVTFFDFFEKHSDLISLMKASKVFVLPSTLEGFGISVIEANACKLPCTLVKSKKNAAVNLIKNNKNGFVINLNKKEMAEKIIYLLKNEDKRKELGEIGFKFAKHFDKNLIIPKIEEYYKKLIKK